MYYTVDNVFVMMTSKAMQAVGSQPDPGEDSKVFVRQEVAPTVAGPAVQTVMERDHR